MADVEKIGLMGHSLGGAASVSVGRYRDDVDAVIDLDGTMLGEQTDFADGKYQYVEEPYPVPLFALDSESHYDQGQKYGNLYVNENNVPEKDIHDLSHHWLAIRTADIECVLDSVEEAKQNGTVNDAWFIESETEKSAIESVLAMADVEKIGLMGHSLGGAASVSVGRYRDDVDAVIDLDGTMLGEQIGFADGKYQYVEEPYPVPLFALDSESHYEQGQKYGTLYVNQYVLEHALDAKHEYIAGAAHMNFTDLPLFSPPLAAALGTGTVDSTECIEAVNAMVLEYMNYYLMGSGK